MKKDKIAQEQQSSKSEKPETKEVQELKHDETEQVNGGNGTFSNIPRVRSYDYDDDIKGKV